MLTHFGFPGRVQSHILATCARETTVFSTCTQARCSWLLAGLQMQAVLVALSRVMRVFR